MRLILALIILDRLTAWHHSADVRKTCAAILWVLYSFGALWLLPAGPFFLLAVLASLRFGLVAFYTGYDVLAIGDMIGWVLIGLAALFLFIFHGSP